MNAEDRKPNTTARWLAVALLLPLIYLLSAAPAFAWVMRHSGSYPAYEKIYGPVEWLRSNTPLKTPLENHEALWFHLFPPPFQCG